jgi:hypothetical protein
LGVAKVAKKVTAAAAGEKSRIEGQGEADRTLAIGTANAQATDALEKLKEEAPKTSRGNGQQ